MKFIEESEFEIPIQPAEEAQPAPVKKCDLFIGKIPVNIIVELLKELSLLNKNNESWWDKNVDSRMGEFKDWIGSQDFPSKVLSRKYVASQEYKSLLDCGCGLCSEYYGYENDGYRIQYIGLDFCAKLVKISTNKGIDVRLGSLEEIPMLDNSVEIAFARHVLEHMFGYEKALSEMIRVASKEALVVFFIPPVDMVPAASDYLKFDADEEIWHNQYQKAVMEYFVLSNPKVDSISWEELPETKESILHIKIKQFECQQEQDEQDE